jgi:SNF2 family DNA or RNA helicase
MAELLTPKKKLTLTRESETYNPREAFWKVVKINQALHLAKVKTLQEAEDLVTSEKATESMAKDIQNDVFDATQYQSLEDFEVPLTVETSADELISVTKEDIAELRRQQQWLDNEMFQWDNHEEACRNLGISDASNPRLPGMVRSAILKFWQPCAIWRIVEIMLSKKTRGAILADSVGLGKTWEGIGVILAVSLTEGCGIRLLQLTFNSEQGRSRW